MKKEYEAPKAEKLEFNYSESVVACNSNNGQSDSYNDDPNGQYFKCTCSNYYAPGWGQNC